MTHWFVIEEGWGAGRPRLEGWAAVSFQGVNDDLAFEVCPRCAAMVLVSPIEGNKTWEHEQWHAATDFPIPAEIRARVADVPRASLEERVRELEGTARDREDYEREMRERGDG